MDYVTFNESGALTGGFCQDLHDDHAAAHIEVSEEVRRDWVLYVANEARDGVELAPVVVRPLTQADYTAALEGMYDARARERQYDNRLTCALRAGYAGPFQAEGTAFAIWMDTCNATAYGLMAQVLAGEIPMPTIAELLAMMPELVWP